MSLHRSSSPRFSSIELLEARIAPAGILTITDIDGDTVVIKTSKGTTAQLTAALTLSGMGLNGTIREIDFSRVALVGGLNPFAGTNLAISVTKQGPLGDGRVHVGYIDASSTDGGATDGTGIALGNVKIAGDLGQIDAGLGGTAAAIKSLTVQSLGAWGNGNQGANGSNTSNLLGKVGKIKILGTMNASNFTFNGTVASIDIGGSMLDSAFSGSGVLAKVRIGAGALGSNIAATSITAMEIKGTLGANIATTANLGVIKIGGDMLFSKINAVNIKSITIKGSIYGQDGLAESGSIVATGNVGTIKLSGDLRGGSATSSGRIFAAGNIDSVSIGGSLLGPVSAPDTLPSNFFASNSSVISAGGNLKNVRIGGNMIGPIMTSTGRHMVDCCSITAGGDIGTVTIGGSFIGNSGDESQTRANSRIVADHIGSVTIKGDFAGTSPFAKIPEILAEGGGSKLAIGKVIIGGSMRFANVIAGALDLSNGPRNADGQIGSVSIRGNLASATIATLDVGVGVTDDINMVSKIASISIGGSITGNAVIRAEHIVSAKLSGVALKLIAGARTDTTAFVFAPGSGSIAEYL